MNQDSFSKMCSDVMKGIRKFEKDMERDIKKFEVKKEDIEIYRSEWLDGETLYLILKAKQQTLKYCGENELGFLDRIKVRRCLCNNCMKEIEDRIVLIKKNLQALSTKEIEQKTNEEELKWLRKGVIYAIIRDVMTEW